MFSFLNYQVSELKQLLKERNLAQSGVKADLVARLEEYNNNATQQNDINGVHEEHSSQVTSVQETINEPAVVDETIILQTNAVNPLKRPAPAQILTEEDRKKMRSEKFGIVVEADKIAKRGERFGTGEAADKASVEKIKNRAERFGIVSPIAQTAEEKDRIDKRKERFGNVANDSNSSKPISSDSAIAKRQNRFGIVEQDKPKNRTNNNNNNNNNGRRQFNNNRQFNNRRRF